MTEQPPPSAEALAVADEFCSAAIRLPPGATEIIAKLLDLFAERAREQRVSDEIERCAKIAAAQKTEAALERHKAAEGEEKACWLWAFDTANMIEREIRAPAERPAPEGPNPFRASLLARMQEIQGQQPLASSVPSVLASTGEQPDKEEDFGEGSVLNAEPGDTQPGCGPEGRPTPEAIFHWFDAWLEDRLNDREKTIIREVFYCLDHPEDVTRMKNGRPVPPTGRVELSEQSNTDSSPETTPATPPSPPAVVDYTERARPLVHEICPNALHVDTYHASCDYPDCRESLCEFWKSGEKIAAALSAVASEHQAEIEALRGELGNRNRENLALYEAAANHEKQAKEAESALLARLREPDEALVKAVAVAMCEAWFYCDVHTPDGAAQWRKTEAENMKKARAALAVITEKLT